MHAISFGLLTIPGPLPTVDDGTAQESWTL